MKTSFLQTLKRLTSLFAVTGLISVASAGTYVFQPPVGMFKNPSGGMFTFPTGSFVYSGNQSSYGYQDSVNGTNGEVKGTGEIDSVYNWVPNQIPNPSNPSQMIPDPLDLPPSQVIVKETCTVSASAQVQGRTGNVSASCNSGLGFQVTTTSGITYINAGGMLIPNGSYATATASGTRYINYETEGKTTITIRCSPMVDANAPLPGAGASVTLHYGSSIIIPTIQIAGTTRVNLNTIGVITGQQLQVSVNPAGLIVNPKQPIAWTISGADPFKNYIASTSNGQRVELTTPLNTSTVSYYTNASDTNTVMCTVQFELPSGATFAGSLPSYDLPTQTVTSVRPTGTFTVASGSIAWNSPQVSYGFIKSTDGTVPDGQEWTNATITVGGGFPQVGNGSFIQIITASRRGDRNTSGFPSEYVNWDTYPSGMDMYGVIALDSGVPYPYGSTWAVSGLGSGVDNPEQLVNLVSHDNGGNFWIDSSSTDSMTTWMMYQPPSVGGMGTVLIPIAKYGWGWNASATYSSSTTPAWTLTPGTPISAQPMNATDHPQWGNFLPSPFQFGPPQ